MLGKAWLLANKPPLWAAKARRHVCAGVNGSRGWLETFAQTIALVSARLVPRPNLVILHVTMQHTKSNGPDECGKKCF